MRADKIKRPEIPANPAENVLEQVIQAAHIADRFKRMIVELSVDDSGEDFEEIYTNPTLVDAKGKVLTDSNMSVGGYSVSPSRAAEVNPENYIYTSVALATLDGGRVYSLFISTALDIPTQVDYLEVPGVQGSLNVAANFKVEASEDGSEYDIGFWRILAIDGLTTQVRKLMKTKRMVHIAWDV